MNHHERARCRKPLPRSHLQQPRWARAALDNFRGEFGYRRLSHDPQAPLDRPRRRYPRVQPCGEEGDSACTTAVHAFTQYAPTTGRTMVNTRSVTRRWAVSRALNLAPTLRGVNLSAYSGRYLGPDSDVYDRQRFPISDLEVTGWPLGRKSRDAAVRGRRAICLQGDLAATGARHQHPGSPYIIILDVWAWLARGMSSLRVGRTAASNVRHSQGPYDVQGTNMFAR
jgi:hypothetical protein